ncbi:hypothetical protein GVAV_002578 [Gurleya vavrai]
MNRPIRKTFLRDIVDFSALTIHALRNDNFTKCFEPISPLEMDNSGFFYIFSFFIRYFVFFPVRLTFLILSTIIFVPIFAFSLFFKLRTDKLFRLYSLAFLKSFGATIHYHGFKKRESIPHIYVANHTSFVDYIILSSHRFCHACVSEDHGGLFGFLFRNILKLNGSICFKRSEKHDREIVGAKLKEHVEDTERTPMLIFPEGTCVNNKYTVLFQKGTFEMQDCLFLPVAIKFRRNIMDPYWNRRKHTFSEHILYLMTRWRLEADVWFLDGLKRSDYPDECASEFANRIKEMISEIGGLKSMQWNGYFKSSPVLRDREILREGYREMYRKRESYYVLRKDEFEGEHRFERIYPLDFFKTFFGNNKNKEKNNINDDLIVVADDNLENKKLNNDHKNDILKLLNDDDKMNFKKSVGFEDLRNKPIENQKDYKNGEDFNIETNELKIDKYQTHKNLDIKKPMIDNKNNSLDLIKEKKFIGE